MKNLTGILGDLDFIKQNFSASQDDYLDEDIISASKILEGIFIKIEESRAPTTDAFDICRNILPLNKVNMNKTLKTACCIHDAGTMPSDHIYHTVFHHAKVMIASALLASHHNITDPEILYPLISTALIHDFFYEESKKQSVLERDTIENISINKAFEYNLFNNEYMDINLFKEINKATIFPTPVILSENEKIRTIQELLAAADLMPSLGISSRFFARETKRIELENNILLDNEQRYNFATQDEVIKRIQLPIKNTIFEMNYNKITEYLNKHVLKNQNDYNGFKI